MRVWLGAPEVRAGKAGAEVSQRGLLFRHRDHQTVMTSNKTRPLEGHDEGAPERLIDG